MEKFKGRYVSVNVDVDVDISDIIYGQLQNLKTDIQKRMAIALFLGVPIHSANDFDRIVSELKDYYIC